MSRHSYRAAPRRRRGHGCKSAAISTPPLHTRLHILAWRLLRHVDALYSMAPSRYLRRMRLVCHGGHRNLVPVGISQQLPQLRLTRHPPSVKQRGAREAGAASPFRCCHGTLLSSCLLTSSGVQRLETHDCLQTRASGGQPPPASSRVSPLRDAARPVASRPPPAFPPASRQALTYRTRAWRVSPHTRHAHARTPHVPRVASRPCALRPLRQCLVPTP